MDEYSQDNQNSNSDLINSLGSVKDRALQELLGFLPELNNMSPEKRFEIYISALSSTNETQLAEKALEAARLIQDNEKKAECLSDLIDEISYKIAILK